MKSGAWFWIIGILEIEQTVCILRKMSLIKMLLVLCVVFVASCPGGTGAISIPFWGSFGGGSSSKPQVQQVPPPTVLYSNDQSMSDYPRKNKNKL